VLSFGSRHSIRIPGRRRSQCVILVETLQAPAENSRDRYDFESSSAPAYLPMMLVD